MGRVVVTGGGGKLGRAVVSDLRRHGWKVTIVDRVSSQVLGVPTVVADLRDRGQAMDVLASVDSRYRRVDAVVHLAAIPGPGLVPDSETFEHNVMTTHNVFTGAVRAGIDTVVWASSETLLGIPFETPPPYLPVDEDCPARPESSYALAKHLEEVMAIEFARRNPEMSLTALRFSNVLDESDYRRVPDFDRDVSARRWNLWGYIDARDGAQAVRKALARRRPGFDRFVIANADTVMTRSTKELVAEEFPDVPLRRDLGEHETLLCIDKARRELGFEPEFGWRQAHSGPQHVAVDRSGK